MADGDVMKQISPLGLGCASLGNLYRPISDEQAHETVAAAWDAGLRFFDTAPYYGLGLSERRLGDALRERTRSDYVLSTKVGRILEPDNSVNFADIRYGFATTMPFKVRYDYSYDGVMRSFEASLQRLGLSRIDVLLVHDIGEAAHGDGNAAHFEELVGGGYRALDDLRSAGDISAIGLGANEWQVCSDAMQIGQWDCFLLAGRYTLLEQEPLHKFLPQCEAHGAKVILGGVYNSGILATGTRTSGAVHYDYVPAPKEIIDRVSRIENICEQHGVPLAAAALQFPLAHPVVQSVIPGIDNPERVHETRRLFELSIPDAFWESLVDDDLIDRLAPLPKLGF